MSSGFFACVERRRGADKGRSAIFNVKRPSTDFRLCPVQYFAGGKSRSCDAEAAERLYAALADAK